MFRELRGSVRWLFELQRRFFELQRDYGTSAAVTSVATYGYYVSSDLRPVHDWCVDRFWGFDPESEFDLVIVDADVDRITHTQRFPFLVRGPHAVVGRGRGDWDTMAERFTEHHFYRSLELRFAEGCSWERTPTYRRAKSRIENGRRPEPRAVWTSCLSMTDLQKKCEKIDRLYESMRSNGYESQLRGEWTNSVRGVAVPDEIRLAVARDGTFIRCASGKHRLALAKLLNVKSIPAIVQIEHEEWDGKMAVRERIQA